MKLLVVAALCCVMMVSVAKITHQEDEKKVEKKRGFRKCRTSADCDDNECCLMRGLLGVRPGKCKALAREGESCSSKLSYAGLHGKKYLKYCPCENGLVCELDEPKKELQVAAIFDIYNTCLNKTEIKFIEIEKEKEMDNNTETTSANNTKTTSANNTKTTSA